MKSTSAFTEFVRWVESRPRAYWQDVAPISTEINDRRCQIDLLYREGSFQIERVTHRPFHITPLHRHPLIDSFEFGIRGSGELYLNGRCFKLDDRFTPWRPLFISRRTWHGGRVGERGDSFLSVQAWDGPILGSVTRSWEDKP
jgi:hypothetical protein